VITEQGSGNPRSGCHRRRIAVDRATGRGRRASGPVAPGDGSVLHVAGRPGHRPGWCAAGCPAGSPGVRQGSGGAPQPHLGAPQVGAELRCRGIALLARTHAGGRGGPPVRRATNASHGLRGHRHGRSACAGAGRGGRGGSGAHGHARVRAGARSGRRVPRAGAEIQRDLPGLRSRQEARWPDARICRFPSTCATRRHG
jgi:hypothetical protein